MFCVCCCSWGYLCEEISFTAAAGYYIRPAWNMLPRPPIFAESCPESRNPCNEACFLVHIVLESFPYFSKANNHPYLPSTSLNHPNNTMGEPSQASVNGIIIGLTIGGSIFLIFILTVCHYYSRKMHRPKQPPGSENMSEV